MGFTKGVVQQLSPEEDEEARMLAMRLVTGSCLPMTLNVAIELELLEIIVKAGPGAKLSPDDIATQPPTENPRAADMIDRILYLLTVNSVVNCSVGSGDDGCPSG